MIWKPDFSKNNYWRKFHQPQNCHLDVYIYSGTPLARPPTGRRSIGSVNGTGVVASHLHSWRFHVGYYRDHFISTSLSSIESYLALSYVLREPIVTVL